MHYQLSWIDDDKKILLVNMSGLWNVTDMVAQWREVLTHKPVCLIMDATNLIVVSETYEMPDKGSERYTALEGLAKFMQQAEFKQFYVVENTEHSVFDSVRETIVFFGVGEKAKSVSSVDAALEDIQVD